MVNPSNWRLGGSSFSFSTEMAGAVVTYLLLEIVLGTRQKKETLIANIGSQIKDVALYQQLRNWEGMDGCIMVL